MTDEFGTCTLWRSVPEVSGSGIADTMTLDEIKLQQVGNVLSGLTSRMPHVTRAVEYIEVASDSISLSTAHVQTTHVHTTHL